MPQTRLPNPTPEEVKLWLKTLQRQNLHDEGWIQANRRFYGIASAARPFINQHYSNPNEQEAAFDGMALALLAVSRFGDIDKLAQRLKAPADSTRTPVNREV